MAAVTSVMQVQQLLLSRPPSSAPVARPSRTSRRLRPAADGTAVRVHTLTPRTRDAGGG
jgi:hypothetical protein